MSRKKKMLSEYSSLEDYIKSNRSPKYKIYQNGRTCYDAFKEVQLNLKDIVDNVEMGAMKENIDEKLEAIKTNVEKCDSEEKKQQVIKDSIFSDSVIFLNNHGRNHLDKVAERAFDIVKHFDQREQLSEIEVFLMLCAIEIHDIGNILGRNGHEIKLQAIFDDNCSSIIKDTFERRIIKNIASAHGGKNSEGSKDTISEINYSENFGGDVVRTRLLAAIIRFADELADDNTRANRAARDLNILGINSQIFHEYSLALHSVKIDEEDEFKYVAVKLDYDLDAEGLEKKYAFGGFDKYLLDEIYDRTYKMEQEREYCMKFFNTCKRIDKIQVRICIYGPNTKLLDTISYTLEDNAYPTSNGKKRIMRDNTRNSVPTGEEELNYIKERMRNNE